jgi:hypothetical protein
MADMMNPAQRNVAHDTSAINKADFFGGVAPAAAPVAQPFVGTVETGPAEVVQGIYVAPEEGRGKGGGF